MVLEDFLRGCAFFIDSTVYRVIPLLYKLIIYLANVNFTGNSNTLSTLTNRIYALVGIFMLFKLSFSILRYIVDPDSFSDSSKGFSNFVRRVLVAFVLLATVPYIFNKMYDFQNVLLSKNVIPNLILGTDENKVDDLESAAKDLQFLLFGSFFTINYDASSFTACTPSEEYPLANVLGSKDMVRVDDGACLEAFSEGIKDRDIASYGVALEDYFKTADDAGTISDMRRFEAFNPLIKWKDANKYSFDYLPLSIICGIYLVFLLLSFCIDIAGRAIRLLFMQALSPVAIVSSVDPASSSQGEKLKEWIMECLKVFFSLFIRLAVIYSVIQLVKIISESVIPSNQSLYYNSNLTNTQGGKSMNLYIYIFLILGSFQVAKKIPELLEKALGIKFSGELQLNPFKALKENAGVGLGLKGFGIGAGAAVGSLAGARAGIEAGAPIRGFLGGALIGATKGYEEKFGIGMFGNIRRKTYKDMTGSDLSSYNPFQKLYGFGGANKVQQLKDNYRNVAYQQLNDTDTELNAVSHQNAQNYSLLRNSGINAENGTSSDGVTIDQRRQNMNDTQRSIQAITRGISQQRSTLNHEQSSRKINHDKVSDLRRQIDDVNAKLNDKNRLLLSDGSNSDSALKMLKEKLNRDYNSAKLELDKSDRRIKELEDDIATRQENLDSLTDSYNTDNSIVHAYMEYKDGIAYEQELRERRANIERNISTINDEISDMQTFYHVDESTRETVAKAKEEIDRRR